MSSRITSDQRDNITNAILKHGFEDKEKEIKLEEQKLNLEILEEVVPKNIRQLLQALPEGVAHESDSFRVWLDSDTLYWVQFDQTKRLPFGLIMGEDHPCISKQMCEAVRKFKKKGESLNRQYSDAKKQITTMLKSCSSLKSLVKAWPEIASIVEKLYPGLDEARQLPVVPIQKLNHQLGLPPT